jgi:cytidyltransferase-like protein
LQEARKMGDRLVVSVTSDRYVNKGPGRPHFTEAERVEALMEMRCVDEVKINDAPDAVAMINHVRPSVYVKGIDYTDARDDEGLRRETFAVAAVGGDMTFTSTRKWSSTELLPEFERGPFDDYLNVLRKVECDCLFQSVLDMLILARTNRHRIFFIGNGGSAAIASHMAADWKKTGKP